MSSRKRTYYKAKVGEDKYVTLSGDDVKRHKRYNNSNSKKIAPAVVTYINKRLAREGETKYWYDYGANISITTCSGTVPQYRSLMPVLSQGNTAYTRIGNKVKVFSAMIRGQVNILPYNALSNPLSTPILIKMWLVSAKQLNTTNLSSTDVATSFFDTSGGSTGFQGTPLDMTLFVNPEKWHVWETRQFEIGATYASTTGPVSTGGYFDNSNMTKHFEIDFARVFKRETAYDDATTSATNMNAFIIFQAVNADGSSSGSYISSEFHYTIQCCYKDV